MSRRRKRRMGRAPEVAPPVVEPVEFEFVDDVPGASHPLDEVAAGLDAGKTGPRRAVNTPATKPNTPHRRPTVGETKRDREPKVAAAPGPTAKPIGTAAKAGETPNKPRQAETAEAASPKPVAKADAAADAARVHSIAPRQPADEVEPEARHDVHTVGELLQRAREARGLSLEETSARTRIALKMLRHLENDHFDEFPADAYVKGFLRSYGGFLGLEVGMLIRRYEAFAGRLSAAATPEVWEEHDEPAERRPHVQLPVSGRVLAAVGAAVVLVLLAWVLWSQSGARLGLRPTGGLDGIEQDLRGAGTSGALEPQTASVDRDAAPDDTLPTDATAGAEDAAARVPAITGAEGANEDTAPPLPPLSVKPVEKPVEKRAVKPTAPNPQPPQASANAPSTPPSAPASTTTKPTPKPAKKPVPKKEPRTSPEDAAGPPR